MPNYGKIRLMTLTFFKPKNPMKNPQTQKNLALIKELKLKLKIDQIIHEGFVWAKQQILKS